MLRDRIGAHRFVLAGVCSGAFSAFSSGLRAEGVVRAVLVNPLAFYWKEGMTLDTPTYQHFLAVRHYRHSVRAWSSWKKLLSGKVNPAPVARVGLERARRLLYARWQGTRHVLGLDRNDAENLRRVLRHLVGRGVRVSFVFAAGDPGYDLLMLEAGGVVRTLERAGQLSVDVIADADHTFTPFAPRRRLAELLTDIVAGTRLPGAKGGDAGA